MRAYTAKYPTTPGFKLELRNQLEHMLQQIQHMTANLHRIERLNMEQEYEDYESSDDEECHATDPIIPVPPLINNSVPEERPNNKEVKKGP